MDECCAVMCTLLHVQWTELPHSVNVGECSYTCFVYDTSDCETNALNSRNHKPLTTEVESRAADRSSVSYY